MSSRVNQLVEAGLWLRMSGDVEGARRLFEQALRLDPTSLRARELLGESPPESAAVPQELRGVPETKTDLFTVPLPRLFADEAPPAPATLPEDWWTSASPAASASGFAAPAGGSLAPGATGHFHKLPPELAHEVPTVVRPPATSPSPAGARSVPLPEPTWRSRSPAPVPGPGAIPALPRERTPGPAGSPALSPPPGAWRTRTPGPSGPPSAPGSSPGAPANDPVPLPDARAGRTPMPVAPVARTPPPSGPGAVPLPAGGRPVRTPPPAGPHAVPLPDAAQRRGTPPPSGPGAVPLPPGGWGTGPSAGARTASTPPAAGPGAVPLPDGRLRTPSPVGAGSVAAMPPLAQRGPDAGVVPEDGWGDEEPPTVLGLGDGRADALELVGEPRRPTGLTPPPFDPRSEVARLLERARELQGLDDHTGAREVLLRARELDPEYPGLSDALARSEAKLQTIYESKLGKLTSVPRVRLREDEIIWLNLDHRAGFMLAQIDGTLSFEDLFSVSGMSRLDTARILAQLLDQRVIVRA